MFHGLPWCFWMLHISNNSESFKYWMDILLIFDLDFSMSKVLKWNVGFCISRGTAGWLICIKLIGQKPDM